LKLQPWHRLVLALWAASLLCAFAQDASQAAPKAAPPAAVAPHARLLAARSIYIQHAGGRLPNDVIGDAFQGWGRYIVVHDPAQADLIVSINAPVSDTGLSVGGGGSRHGAPPPGHTTSSSDIVRLTILDAHDRVVLWSGSEQSKSSFKEKQREDNEVEASLRLFRRFRNLIEPEPAP
jgi:hypothetical protein